MKFLTRAAITVAAVYFSSICIVEGLKCWTCENADSVEECDRKGKLATCSQVQQVCAIEIRHQGSWAFPDRVKVFKYCKQARACDNVQNQNNKPAYKQTQCNPKWPYSVCRCCCQGDGCNVGDMKCLELEVPKRCPPITTPRYGEVRCSNGSYAGSQCSFQCRNGYRMLGPKTRVCGENEKWTGLSPICQPITCSALPSIENGEVACSNKAVFGSVCAFSCHEGYRLIGPGSSTCQLAQNDKLSAKWSTNGQICQRKTCSPLYAPAYGSISCTDSYFTGSVCEFSCDGIYNRIGSQHSTCKDNYMYGRPHWDNDIPRCETKRCPYFPNTPGNGFMVCTDGRIIDSVCEFACDEGYKIVGELKTTCFYDENNAAMKWSKKEPTCERKRCGRDLETPANGDVYCNDFDYLGSVCTFSCGSIYYLDGAEDSECVENKDGDMPDWNRETPVCKKRHCGSKPASPVNGFISCSDEAFLGSLCEFSCDNDYYRSGHQFSTCTRGYTMDDTNGDMAWDNETPQCIRKECATLLRTPTHGFMKCSDMKFLHSACEFGCDSEYDLKGDMTSSCVENAKSGRIEWTKMAPKCIRKRCQEYPTAPPNGNIDCNSGNLIGSECTFTCDNAYYLVGEETSTCAETKTHEKPQWSKKVPTCQRKRCEFTPKAPVNGNVYCSNYDYRDSICQFTCDKAYNMEGFANSTCVENFSTGKLMWNNESPTCIRKECRSHLSPPTNGFAKCTDMQYLGSVCSFHCDEAYDLVGRRRSTCVENYDSLVIRWDSDTPDCARKECAYLPNVPSHGNMRCTDKKFYGSTCSFYCEKDYKLLGSEQTQCTSSYRKSSRPTWDYETPLCIMKKCSDMQAPQNGKVVCDDENRIGSTCEFVCDDFHRRRGPLRTICTEENGHLKWTKPSPPSCERISCPELNNIRHGKMKCTDGEFVNSECSFECTMRDYHLTPNTRRSITCQNDTTWSEKPPCCARLCPPFAVMDLVVILDSSSSIGLESWKVMLKFVNAIFDLFTVKRDAMNFGVVRYNNKIDQETQIHLNDCPDNATMLQELVSKLPYNGQGTWTGQAMSYVRDNMLKPRNGDRKNAPNVVLVITDGRSQDDVTKPAYALREDGVLTFALGITPTNGRLDMSQLEDIAGSEKHLFLAKDGFDTLTPEFAREISENLCGDPCERSIY